MLPQHMETLIFMDFETTGLPADHAADPLLNMGKLRETTRERTLRLQRMLHADGNCWRGPWLTEMSFVCIPRSLFVDGAKWMQSHHFVDSQSGQNRFEHAQCVTNVHTRQLDPALSAAEWANYERLQRITPSIRLKKSELLCQNTFAQEWPSVQHMLATVRKPACLIAHNGINFDFRLLFHELRRAGLLHDGGPNGSSNTGTKCCPIPEQIFFLDSLHSLLDIESEYNREMEITTQNVDWRFVFSQSQQQIGLSNLAASLDDDDDEAHAQQQQQGVEIAIVTTTTTTASVSTQTTTNNKLIFDESSDGGCQHTDLDATAIRRPFNAGRTPTTPENTRANPADEQNYPANRKRAAKRALDFGCLCDDANATSSSSVQSSPYKCNINAGEQQQQPHPIDFMHTTKWSPAKRCRINGKFFERSNNGNWAFNAHQARAELMARGTFRLEALHNRLFATPFQSHRAQADCEALLQICLAYGMDWLLYMDRNASTFPDCFRTAGEGQIAGNEN